MPVSRKRKKKSQSGRRPSGPTPSKASLAGAFDDLFERRRRLNEHRTALAGDAAGAMIDALTAAAPGWSDDDIEDDLCVRYGAAMIQYEGAAVADRVNPEDMVGALLSAIDERLHAAAGADVAVLQRLLTIVAGVLPFPLSESARDLVAEHVGALEAKLVAGGRAVTGPVLWARDAYGVRWAVVAPFASAGGPDRWYLWDVDTCGYEVATVDSGFHPSAESALAAWRESVGQAAAGVAALTPLDDKATLGDLLRGQVESARIGGESQEQYAEFLRGRRLGGTVKDAVRGLPEPVSERLTADEAGARFARRLRELGYPDGPAGDGSGGSPAGADELAVEMAESWSPQHHPTLYPFCSPHKVAQIVLHLRGYYQNDFAVEIIAVLPEWIRFLAEHNGMAAELTERCLAYASGDLQFPGILDDRGQPNPMARVVE
ncbi:hypothetical protein DMB66_12580 [Actinoplanes sp. ATCC 53533]|uniref:hypothetical protein n=1 Tax=Actinoplanes sp. ATCC 53533 TaxID=1288362 RepID=UPI000F7B6FC1|nr:hypothetical protein [Actinoplanes sp. ATCC 53533]RSM68796.1 hypothetical protein DMB66_12580 [Actinoplanes sp. ATCC 53533]